MRGGLHDIEEKQGARSTLSWRTEKPVKTPRENGDLALIYTVGGSGPPPPEDPEGTDLRLWRRSPVRTTLGM
jgi:hypothetical protein